MTLDSRYQSAYAQGFSAYFSAYAYQAWRLRKGLPETLPVLQGYMRDLTAQVWADAVTSKLDAKAVGRTSWGTGRLSSPEEKISLAASLSPLCERCLIEDETVEVKVSRVTGWPLFTRTHRYEGWVCAACLLELRKEFPKAGQLAAMKPAQRLDRGHRPLLDRDLQVWEDHLPQLMRAREAEDRRSFREMFEAGAFPRRFRQTHAAILTAFVLIPAGSGRQVMPPPPDALIRYGE